MIWEGVAEARFREGGHRWPFHVRMKRRQWKEMGVQHYGTMNGESKVLGTGQTHSTQERKAAGSGAQGGRVGRRGSATEEKALVDGVWTASEAWRLPRTPSQS